MRIGVIGLGTVGRTHVDALRELGGTEIWGADPSPAARERATAEGIRCVADAHELIATGGLDGVVISTPPRSHLELARAAIRAGIGALCEKPLALTLAECQAIADEAAAGRGVFAVGFCHRFQPQVRALRELVAAGDLGQPVLVRVSFVHGITEQGRTWITDRAQAGGGVLVDSGSHAIDLVRFLAGDIDDVHGFTAVLDGAAKPDRVEDASVVALRAGAVLGTIALSWKTPPWAGHVDVVGTRGRARVEYDGDDVTLAVRHGDSAWQSVKVAGPGRFVGQMAHFLRCLRGEEAPLVTALDGLEATRTWLRVYGQLPDGT